MGMGAVAGSGPHAAPHSPTLSASACTGIAGQPLGRLPPSAGQGTAPVQRDEQAPPPAELARGAAHTGALTALATPCNLCSALCTGEKGVGKSGVPLHYKGSVFHRVM